MSDRFAQPGPPRGGEGRRVFIPAPSDPPPGSRGNGAAGGVADRPRPRPDGGPRARQRPPGHRPPSPPRRSAPPSGPWYRRVRWRRVLAISAVVLLLLTLGGYLYARSVFNRIEKVDLGDSLTSASSGTNYLVVGSDSRDESAAEHGSSDARADTMMIMHTEGGTVQLLSIPRDLYLPISGMGSSHKLNAAYNPALGGGPERLVDTITAELGIPIDRYIEVDFVSLAGLVDAVGGVTIDFEHPASDDKSGLFVPDSGPVELDGEQALAYVRSREYTEHINGQPVRDPSADLGRMRRQQTFLTAVFGTLNDSRNPLTTMRVATNVASGLRIDDEMTMFDAFRFLWSVRGMQPETLEPLDMFPDRNDSGAVLVLRDGPQPSIDAVR